ncbi:hypothetical protein N658DRAFT_481426 [Parathielavia hyrcaniae]|uniref:Rieske domain-containing protein n=1 Tax=Parathielavia hyrcaniae TaxID=113614 RepID=A0AAN6PQ78_9PEZI|nr:hypothetical protein N658DRAFT_481426 [Parathielavia hyrcaniae]
MNPFSNPFRAPSRTGTEWFSVGTTSEFPEVAPADDTGTESESKLQVCGNGAPDGREGCKVFHVPKTDVSQRTEVEIAGNDLTAQNLTDQVLVFQYHGKIHAIDHAISQCPHSSFPLSQGIPFDIEDFGIVLSAGLTCPKHNWSFDLFSGRADRGNYRLKVWEVQLREVVGSQNDDKEVWVRRKPRIG